MRLDLQKKLARRCFSSRYKVSHGGFQTEVWSLAFLCEHSTVGYNSFCKDVGPCPPSYVWHIFMLEQKCSPIVHALVFVVKACKMRFFFFGFYNEFLKNQQDQVLDWFLRG